MEQEKQNSGSKQELLLKIIVVMLGIIMAVVVISAAIVVPKAVKVMNQASNMLTSTQEAVDNLNSVAAELKEADIPGLMEETRSLVDTSAEGIEDAVEKIGNFDIDTLNSAIDSLEKVVTPLANLIGK